jgi:hypothetical protein
MPVYRMPYKKTVQSCPFNENTPGLRCPMRRVDQGMCTNQLAALTQAKQADENPGFVVD